eukprot:5353674-Amphidinium_carterae.1
MVASTCSVGCVGFGAHTSTKVQLLRKRFDTPSFVSRCQSTISAPHLKASLSIHEPLSRMQTWPAVIT